MWKGYTQGFVRTACWCCPGQRSLQAYALQKNYPGLADEIRWWEKRLGQKLQWMNDKSFDDIVAVAEKTISKSQ